MEASISFVDFAARATPEFDSIYQLMFHSSKEEGGRFLCAMNNVVDYVLNDHNQNGSVNCQIIHIPSCPEWARELLLRYMIHKVALTFNATIIKKCPVHFKKVTQLTENQSTKDYLLIRQKKEYFRNIYNLFATTELSNDNSRSLIIIKEQDLKSSKSDKNPWIAEFFTDRIDDEEHNVVISAALSAFDLEDQIRELDPSKIPSLKNIFIFHSPNKGKITNSYNLGQLERLNRYGVGIQNCIVFSFSCKPFRLYKTIENIKYRLASSITNQSIVKYDDFHAFITFTQEESDYMFYRDNNRKTYILDYEDRVFLTYEMDQYLDQLPHNLHYRNALALPLPDDVVKTICSDIVVQIPDLPLEQLNTFCNVNKELWNDDVMPAIREFIEESNVLGIVLPKSLPNAVRQAITRLLQTLGTKVKCFSLEDIRAGVNVKKLIILEFRYTDKIYKSYPNSFDPLPLKPGQEALVFINMLTHSSYYEWNRYWYERDKHGLLYSAFRKTLLGWQEKSFKRPIFPNIRDYINEAENDSREYQSEKCKVYYKNGERSKEYLACDRVLYEENGRRHIGVLKEICMLDGLSIQMIDDLINQVKVLISQKTNKETKAEALFRHSHNDYNISEEEINSPVEFWKILLKRRVSIKGERAVYEELFASIPAKDRISASTFSEWYNFDNNMILPRSRKHQKALLSYLGLDAGQVYPRIILAKKLSSKINSQRLNSQIETLLQKTLLASIDEIRFKFLSESHSDIFTLLSINDKDDLDALIDVLQISLIPVDRIEYDQN